MGKFVSPFRRKGSYHELQLKASNIIACTSDVERAFSEEEFKVSTHCGRSYRVAILVVLDNDMAFSNIVKASQSHKVLSVYDTGISFWPYPVWCRREREISES